MTHTYLRAKEMPAQQKGASKKAPEAGAQNLTSRIKYTANEVLKMAKKGRLCTPYKSAPHKSLAYKSSNVSACCRQLRNLSVCSLFCTLWNINRYAMSHVLCCFVLLHFVLLHFVCCTLLCVLTAGINSLAATGYQALLPS